WYAVLALRMTLRRWIVDLSFSIPPPEPNPALLNATVLFSSLSEDDSTAIPPPLAAPPALTALPEIVLFRTTASTWYKLTPPPRVLARFLAIVQASIVSGWNA